MIQICKDNTLYGHRLFEGLSQLWKFTTSNKIHREKTHSIASNAFHYLELAFRRIGGGLLTACATIVILPIAFAIKLIHFVGRLITDKIGITKASHMSIKTFLKSGVEQTLKNDIEKVTNVPLDNIHSGRFFVNVTYDNKEWKVDYILSSNRESPSSYFNGIISDIIECLGNQTAENIEFKWHFIFKKKEEVLSENKAFSEAMGLIIEGIESKHIKSGFPSVDANKVNLILFRMGRKEEPILDENNNFLSDVGHGRLVSDYTLIDD